MGKTSDDRCQKTVIDTLCKAFNRPCIYFSSRHKSVVHKVDRVVGTTCARVDMSQVAWTAVIIAHSSSFFVSLISSNKVQSSC